MFTSESIEYGLQRAEMELVSEWVFGQDSVDLLRCILKEIEHSYSSEFLSSVKGNLSLWWTHYKVFLIRDTSRMLAISWRSESSFTILELALIDGR